MNNSNMAGLRGMIEQMPTAQLDELLHCELEKEPVDDAAVRLILEVLEERDRDVPIEMNDRIEAAWEKYQSQAPVRKQPWFSLQRWPMRAAAIVAVVALLIFAVPQSADAENFWERLTRWTDSIFEFFAPGDSRSADGEYVFETDNPGLQQVYDTVTALGVTEPVVPMWLPEGFELIECKVIESDTKVFVYSEFSNGENSAVLDVVIRNMESQRQYNKDETNVETREIMGVVHNILHNNDRWTAAWEREKLECAIALDCQEETLYRVLKSIYVMED